MADRPVPDPSPDAEADRAALDYLRALPRYAGRPDDAYRPGLERITALLEAMDRPHEALRCIHVGGTNGKGSTSAMIASVASAAGLRTGLHTSPHLFRLNERLRIDGRPAPDAWLAEAVTRYRDAFEAVGPTFFEATVALSFRYFADRAVDLAVIEVGLGGRLDATNVVQPALTCITSIGRDHTELLGLELPDIAREKAGIVKPDVPLVTSAEQPEVVDVLRRAAEERSAPWHHVLEETEVLQAVDTLEGSAVRLRTPLRTYDFSLELPGRHQHLNARVAVRAAELTIEAVRQRPDAVLDGLAEVHRRAGLRGRLDVLERAPLVVADVAHNPDGLGAALDYVRAHLSEDPNVEPGALFVVLGLLRDKDAIGMAAQLARHGAHVFPTTVGGPRALSAGALSAVLAAHAVPHQAVETPREGVARFRERAEPGDALLIAGSHQLLAALPELFGEHARPA